MKSNIEVLDNSDIVELLSSIQKFCQKNSSPFLDLHFPPLLHKIITNPISCPPKWQNLIWRRSAQILGNDFQLFSKNNPRTYLRESYFYKGEQSKNEIEITDILQGELGNCYFLAALSSLSEFPERIKHLFITKEKNEYGIYAVRLNLDGEWKTVFLDDYFPCYDIKYGGDPCFSHSKQNEIWVMLLEKGWAKLNGGYQNIEAGITSEGLRILTGAPTKVIFHPFNDNDLWNLIVDAFKKLYIVSAGAKTEESIGPSKIRKGIVVGHVYSVFGLYEIDHPSKGFQRIVKVRNPWGKIEWNGNWGDNSEVWTQEMLNKLGHTKADDGMFFMEFKEYLECFGETVICQYNDNYKYSSFKATSDKKAVYYNMKIEQKGEYYITINNVSRRRMPSVCDNYEYPRTKLVIGKILGNSEIKFIDSKYLADHEICLQLSLEKGDYIIYCKIEWTQSYCKEFVISSYGVSNVKWTPTQKIPFFIEKIYLNKAKNSKKKNSLSSINRPEIEKVLELFAEEGYGYFFVENKGSKPFKMKLQLNKCDGLQAKKSHGIEVGNVLEIDLQGYGHKIYIIKVSYDGFSLNYTESITY